MNTFISVWNQLMSIAVFLGLIASAIFLYAVFVPDAFSARVNGFARKNILYIGLGLSLTAIVSSLVYSNVIGYPPCELCWFARIAFYPQALLFALAIAKRDRSIVDYSLGLTIFGMIVSGYHSYIQMSGYSIVPCSLTGPSCVVRYVFEYGFITIPFMGFVGFLVLLLSLIAAKKPEPVTV